MDVEIPFPLPRVLYILAEAAEQGLGYLFLQQRLAGLPLGTVAGGGPLRAQLSIAGKLLSITSRVL